ncbi:MAG: type IX secretion system membrane protein PorP/SprF [Cyclobacteriaceae bacterium]|nr:type IX secretion system membrane protein PorP/SprF [Cyclobacteriaceae bacterium]
MQELPLNSQIFLNPYYYNPAFAGFEDRPAFYLYRRQQWTGIEGAPETVGINFHTIFNEKISFGLYVMNDKASIFNTSRALFTFGYRAKFDEFHYLSFALSGGAGFNNTDLSTIDPDDPAMSNALENSIFLDGNAGFNYYNNGFNLGLSLPKIFKNTAISDQSFTQGEISPLNDVIAMTSYRWEISENNFAFEPWMIYYYTKDLPGQFEAIGLFHLADVFWLGASYRQNYGMSGMVGLNIKDNFKFGYAYEFFTNELGSFNNGTHDIQLAMVFGKKEKKGKVNMIEQRREMLRTMGRLPSQQTKPAPQPAPAPTPAVPAYSDEDALKDLMLTEETPIIEETPVVEEDTISIDNIFIPTEEIETFDEVQPITRTPQPVAAPVIVPEPEVDEEDELIRQMDEEAKITFEEPAELTDTNQRQTAEELIAEIENAEEFVEPTLNNEGVYIGPTTVTKGDHLLELDKGNYVVVGTFGSYREAEEYSDKLFIKGFYTKFGYITQTRIYYVYIFENEDMQECNDTSERFKAVGAQFRENWVLQVQ